MVYSVGRYVTCGSRLYLDYYGRSCEVNVSSVIGDDDSVQNVQADTDVMKSLSRSVDKLNLETSSPEASSTPVKSKPSNKRMHNIPEVPRFYKISHNTRLVVDDDDDDLAKSDIGPSLRDFGGFSQQVEVIKDTIATHLFKSHKLAQQGW